MAAHWQEVVSKKEEQKGSEEETWLIMARKKVQQREREGKGEEEEIEGKRPARHLGQVLEGVKVVVLDVIGNFSLDAAPWLLNNGGMRKELVLKYGRYKNDKRVCFQCGQIFYVENWRKQNFCSQQCGIDSHKGKTYEERNCKNCGKIFRVEAWMKQRFCSFQCGVDYNRGKSRLIRLKCSNKKKKYYPERRLKDGRRMTLHRYLMEEKMGRRLKRSESVHHVDMDKQNNNSDCSNYYLYLNESEHIKGHHSLETLVPLLMKDEIIGFKNGAYYKI